MSKVTLKVKGLKKLIQKNEKYPDLLAKTIRRETTNDASEVIEYSKGNHRFTTRSGQAENSAQYKVWRRGNTFNIKFSLNDALTSVDGDRSYSTFLHEGTYEGYDQSPLAPLYINSTSKSGKGWQADPWLWRAIDAKWDVTKVTKRIAKEMKKEMGK